MKLRKKKKRWETWTLLLLVFPVFLCLLIYWLQHTWVHRDEIFVSEESKVKLTKETDYETFFLQTGLGREAVDKLLKADKLAKIESVQNAFLDKDDVECISVLGWFTRSDRIDSSQSAPIVDLQPGDILISFSTHSIGWRHGHAGLAIDTNYVLECTSWGKDSRIVKSKHWRKYSNYIVLRVKNSSTTEREQVASYAEKTLQGLPYHLSSGFLGEKAPSPDKAYFGLQCAYLVWYAWQEFGYDLDSDGGRLVTANDLFDSELLEIVQVYGMNPKELDCHFPILDS